MGKPAIAWEHIADKLEHRAHLGELRLRVSYRHGMKQMFWCVESNGKHGAHGQRTAASGDCLGRRSIRECKRIAEATAKALASRHETRKPTTRKRSQRR